MRTRKWFTIISRTTNNEDRKRKLHFCVWMPRMNPQLLAGVQKGTWSLTQTNKRPTPNRGLGQIGQGYNQIVFQSLWTICKSWQVKTTSSSASERDSRSLLCLQTRDGPQPTVEIIWLIWMGANSSCVHNGDWTQIKNVGRRSATEQWAYCLWLVMCKN